MWEIHTYHASHQSIISSNLEAPSSALGVGGGGDCGGADCGGRDCGGVDCGRVCGS